MKKVILILGASVLAALIALKITSREGANGPQAMQEVQLTKTTRQLWPREAHTNPASVGTSEPQTLKEETNEADLILFT